MATRQGESVNTIKFPGKNTEVQAAVLEMKRGQRKNAVKFSAFMVLIAAVTLWVFFISATVGDFIKSFF